MTYSSTLRLPTQSATKIMAVLKVDKDHHDSVVEYDAVRGTTETVKTTETAKTVSNTSEDIISDTSGNTGKAVSNNTQSDYLIVNVRCSGLVALGKSVGEVVRRYGLVEKCIGVIDRLK